MLPHGEEFYRSPATAFVADFIGGANVLRGRIDSVDPCRFIAEGLLPLAFDKPLPPNAAALSVRPEDIALRPAGAAGIEGTVRRSRFLGNALDYTIEIGGGRRMVNVRTDGHSAHGEGDRVVLAIDTGKLTVLTEDAD